MLLGPPYDEFNESFPAGGETKYVSDSITQETFGIGVQSNSISARNDVIDAYIGLRWRAIKRLEVIAGFRQTSYGNVGVDLRPDVTGQTLEQVARSVTYEGFYGGVSILLF